MTKRMDGFPESSKRQPLMQSLNGSLFISILLTALASVWIIVSCLLISNSMYQWTAAAIAASLFVTAIIVYIKRNENFNFQNYHTAIVETLLRSDAVPLAVLDRSGFVLEMNDASSRILGYSRTELIGAPISRLLEPASRQSLHETFEQALLGETKQTNINITHGSGFPFELQVICSPMMQDDEVIGIVLISQDLSDRKRNVERIRYMAYYDDMTGLPNRTLFQIKLTETLARAKEEERVVGICYLDLDRFKLVNTSFGRESGDILLMQVAERL
ncbi:MAG TPA: diguanylate cyclase, partial [Candidatus Udaeobacter sp.]|nr:diguanylate cyclase [Candidatus Udaeobacter sp.]